MDVQWQFRFEPHRPAVSRVVEPERYGVQGLTLETNKSVADLFRRGALFGVSRCVRCISTNDPSTTSAATIDWISDQGMSDMSHMHSNLVCTSCRQNTLHQRCDSAKRLQHAVAGQRRLAA